MWFPVEVCRAFEQAFNLTWNATAQLYLMTESQHAALLAQNPTFTFTVGSSSFGGKTAEIDFPYTAFDVVASKPLVDSDARYFPMKRASNSSQYTLGRVFLQEAYIVADYDRRNFSISQALAPSRGQAASIVTIELPAKDIVDYSGEQSQLSTSALAGTVAGGIAGLIVIIAAILIIRKRYRRSSRENSRQGNSKPLAPAKRYSGKPLGLNQVVEMSAADSGIFEPDSQPARPPELDGAGESLKYPLRAYELRDRRSVVVELEASEGRWI